jgi:hypothetical protein
MKPEAYLDPSQCIDNTLDRSWSPLTFHIQAVIPPFLRFDGRLLAAGLDCSVVDTSGVGDIVPCGPSSEHTDVGEIRAWIMRDMDIASLFS